MFWFAPGLRNPTKQPNAGKLRALAEARNANPLAPSRSAPNPRHRAPARKPRASFRKLWPSDRQDILGHFQRLDSETLAARFGGSVSPAYLASYAGTVLGRDVVAYGAYVDGVLRGLAELHLLTDKSVQQDGSLRAEAAFSVEPDFHHHGLGTALAERILAAARNRGVSAILSYCLPENKAIRGLMDKLGASVRLAEGMAAGEIDPGGPNMFGGMVEHLDDAQQLLLRLSPLTMYGRLFPPSAPE